MEQQNTFNNKKELSIHFSGDPDDAYAWWGILMNRIGIPGCQFVSKATSVHENNIACAREIPDVAAISSAAYPSISDNYRILSSGASVGRGYGPALVMRSDRDISQITNKPVAVAGLRTTGATLLRVLYPQCEIVEVPWKNIARSVLSGDVSAGVLIHEELMLWQDKGLKRVDCLGANWLKTTGFPIPVGLVVAHKRLGNSLIELIATALRQSVYHAFANREDGLKFARQYSVTTKNEVTEYFVDCFTNDDTVDLPLDAYQGLKLLYTKMHEFGYCNRVEDPDLVGSMQYISKVG